MKCKHKDCFTCPYPDCILNSVEAVKRDREERLKELKKEQKKSAEKERLHKWYIEHREEVLARKKEAYRAKKRRA